jgi:hypothetical protein
VVAKPVVLSGIAFGLRAVTAGLSPEDRVIIGGLANPFVRPGATVKTAAGQIAPLETKPVSSESSPPPVTGVPEKERKQASRPAAN